MFYHKGVQQDQEEREDLLSGTKGATMIVICYKFNKYGHGAYNYPDPDHHQGCRGSGFVQVGVSLTHQDHEVVIDTNWILIGT